MGTAVAKRSIWAVIAENPFPHFDAETFRSGVATRLQGYADRVGGRVFSPPLRSDASDIFRLQLTDLPFPDGPGRGVLEVTAYKAYGRLYLSLVLDHDRLFRSLDGAPGTRLYLHDFKFVRSYGEGEGPDLAEIDEALEGLERARTAVQAKNRAAQASRSPFARIRIALRCTLDAHPHLSSEPADEEPEAPRRTVKRRQQVLDALRAEDKRPRKIRIRRRRPDEQGPEAV